MTLMEAPAPEARPSRALIVIAMMLALAAVALTFLEPEIAELIPDRWWAKLHLDQSPVRGLPFILAGLFGALVLIALISRDVVLSIISIMAIAAQMNGFRVSIIDAFDVALLIGLLYWVASLLTGRDKPLFLSGVVWFGFAMLLLALPYLMIQNPARFIIGYLGILRAVIVALLVTNLIQDRQTLDRALMVFIYVAAASGLIGILQFLAAYFYGFHFTFIDPPETAFKPTPIGIVMRASGLCITAQHMSSFLAFVLPLTLWRATHTWKLFDIILVGLTGFGILLTWNMGAVLVVAVMLAVFPLLRWPRLAPHFLTLYVLIAVAIFYSGLYELIYKKVFDTGTAKGASQRGTLLLLGLDKLDRNVLVGTGPQGFARYSGNFWQRPVHNAYVQAATELGLLASLTFIAMPVSLLTRLALALRHVTVTDRPLIFCFIFSTITLMVLMNSEPMLDHGNTWLFLGLIQASLTIVLRDTGRAITPPPPAASPAIAAP